MTKSTNNKILIRLLQKYLY